MTVLQEEQEKPQIETGPTRHAKIMRGIVTPIFGLLAIACVVFGVLNSTVWKPDNEITAAAPVNGSEYVVTDPNVLQLVDSRVNISAKSRDKKSNVCIAIGSARDVAGWIAGSKYMRVSGLSDWTTLSTMKVSAQGTADNSQNQVAFKDSDMWRTIKCNDGAVDMQVKGSNSNNAEDVVALIDFGNRKGDTVTLNWDRRNLPNFAMPLYLAGGLLAILAVLSASVFAMPPHKRRNKRAFAMVEGVGVNEGDENEVSAWVKNAETAASNRARSRSHHGRRRHAEHRTGGRMSSFEETQQPVIVDPVARNLVADQQNTIAESQPTVSESTVFESTAGESSVDGNAGRRPRGGPVMRKRSQAIIAAMLALGMAVGMCGCEGQLPTPKATTRQDAPNLSAKQEQKVRTRILKTLDQCNQNRDTDTLPTILEGPELDIRTSELNVAKATGNLDRKTTIPTDLAQAVISTDAGWPRSVFSITSTTKDQQSKRLLVFRQDSARQNYKLWGVARLFSGVKMPSFEISKTGSAQGTPTDTGLVMTPKAAVDAYADLLQNGANSKYASKFADDDLRSKLADLTAQVQKAMELNEGTQQQTFEPVNGAISVMRSADGGDLVVAQINSEWTRSAGAGRESQPASDAEKALFGNGKATSTMKTSYVNVIALYVPPANSGQKITAVGSERQPVKVEAL